MIELVAAGGIMVIVLIVALIMLTISECRNAQARALSVLQEQDPLGV